MLVKHDELLTLSWLRQQTACRLLFFWLSSFHQSRTCRPRSSTAKNTPTPRSGSCGSTSSTPRTRSATPTISGLRPRLLTLLDFWRSYEKKSRVFRRCPLRRRQHQHRVAGGKGRCRFFNRPKERYAILLREACSAILCAASWRPFYLLVFFLSTMVRY